MEYCINSVPNNFQFPRNRNSKGRSRRCEEAQSRRECLKIAKAWRARVRKGPPLPLLRQRHYGGRASPLLQRRRGRGFLRQALRFRAVRFLTSSVTVLAFATLLLAPSSVQAGNLLVNPSFEANSGHVVAAGWTYFSPPTPPRSFGDYWV